ncbi:MAG: LysE family transporter [Gammaproteobacteria bacterium]
MIESPLAYLLLGLLASFLGTLPFGPINLTVVKITVDYDRLRGLEVAVAASLVEIAQVSVALWFGMVITAFLAENLLFRFTVAAVFIGLAIFIYCQKNEISLQESNREEKSLFRRGILIAALNPQAAPFWVFALAAIDQYVQIDYSGVMLLMFLTGVAAGKLLALYGFVIASGYLKTHLSKSSQLVNSMLAAILLVIGLGQAWNAFTSLAA